MYKRLLVGLLATQVALLLAGCGGEGDEYTIADGTLSGKLNGQSWTLGAAYTDDFLSTPEKYFATFYVTDPGGCNAFGAGEESTILLSLPKEPGEYQLGLSQNMTFAFDDNGTSQNFVATTGKLEITEVTDTMVKGGLYAIYNGDANFEVSGRFQATVCPGSTP